MQSYEWQMVADLYFLETIDTGITYNVDDHRNNCGKLKPEGQKVHIINIVMNRIYIPAQNYSSCQSQTSTWQPFSSRRPGPDDHKETIIRGYIHNSQGSRISPRKMD